MSDLVDERHDVVIVGAGPTGLAAARRLRERGIDDTVVLDREAEAGGIPRHCGHTGFGMFEFHRLMTGPKFARRMVAAASGVDVRTMVTVTGLERDGILNLSTPSGPMRIQGRRVLLATGVFETPRSARIVSGTRPWGVMTTGALQQFVYLSHTRPFSRAVVIGTELVSFSAILTLRHGGIELAAMIEENDRITAPRPADLAARHLFSVPVLTGTRLVSIEGHRRVEGVVIEKDGAQRSIDCDGVVFSGLFRPESTLLRASHLLVDAGSRGPAVDQYRRCSDSTYYAGGNLIHPVETAGHCYREGRRLADIIAIDLAGKLQRAERHVRVECGESIRYVCPQVISQPDGLDWNWSFNLRADREVRGRLQAVAGERTVWSRSIHALPERHLSLPARILGEAPLDCLRIDLTRG